MLDVSDPRVRDGACQDFKGFAGSPGRFVSGLVVFFFDLGIVGAGPADTRRIWT
jgi:hypothetical protein